MGALSSVMQQSFTAGELSPGLHGRTDLAKYHAGAALLRNFFVQAYGGAASRAGTAIVGRCKQPYGTPPRDIDFIFSTTQAYVLEFGDLYMRVISAGGYVLESAKAIAGVTNANPGVFNIVAHGWSIGDQIFIFDAAGMTQINSTPGYQYLVDAVPDANHVRFTDLDGNIVDTSGFGAYIGSGEAARIYTLVTPYAAADLPILKYAQSADVLTLTHPNYIPYDIARIADDNWTITAITFASMTPAPANLIVAPFDVGTGTTYNYPYCVTATNADGKEESLPSSVVSATNHALGDTSGSIRRNDLSWDAVADASVYTIYKAQPNQNDSSPIAAVGTIYGYIGQSTSLEFSDTNFAPDFSRQPPTHRNPFSGGVNPSCAAYFQSRKIYAGPVAFPEALYASQTANYNNMDVHSPALATDAITVSLTSRQVNRIRHLVSMNALLALTSSGAWSVTGGQADSTITPSTISAQPQSFNGCSEVRPLTVGHDILYVQARGSKVRDLSYNFYVNVYTGNDMSVLANHLFYSFNITEWCYAEEPWYQIAGVRNDGQMLSFTYLKEQDVYAWTHYDTPGNPDTSSDKFISIASIPEGDVDAIYCVVARTVPGVNAGNPVYYQERFNDRNFYVNGVADVRQAWCLDSGIRYSGAPVMAISGLQHLEGALVSILADGSVMPPRRVLNGSITLDQPASVVLIGLPFTCQLQTLRIDVGEPTIQGKRKKISRVSLIVQDTRGLKVGPLREGVEGELIVGPLTLIKERVNQPWNSPIQLKTGMQSLIIAPQWQIDGACFIEQSDPLPATILAVIPTITVGDDGG